MGLGVICRCPHSQPSGAQHLHTGSPCGLWCLPSWWPQGSPYRERFPKVSIPASKAEAAPSSPHFLGLDKAHACLDSTSLLHEGGSCPCKRQFASLLAPPVFCPAAPDSAPSALSWALPGLLQLPAYHRPVRQPQLREHFGVWLWEGAADKKRPLTYIQQLLSSEGFFLPTTMQKLAPWTVGENVYSDLEILELTFFYFLKEAPP